MPHIHEKIDFTSAALIVRDGKVLMIKHKKFNQWLPPGGHIELDEDPEQAIYREIQEETGLDIRLIGDKPPTDEPGRKALVLPRWMDIHATFTAGHQHVGFIYLAVPTSGTATLNVTEHDDLQWFSNTDLDGIPSSEIPDGIRWYAKQAILELDPRCEDRLFSPADLV